MAVAVGAAAFAMTSCGGSASNSNQGQEADSVACQGKDSASCETDSMATTTMAMDFPVQGSFKGTLPCADCPGLETTLTLGADGAYTLVQTYEKKGEPGKFEYTGMATCADSVLTLPIKDGENEYPMLLKVGEGTLMVLSGEGEMPAEPEMYTLTKMQ